MLCDCVSLYEIFQYEHGRDYQHGQGQSGSWGAGQEPSGAKLAAMLGAIGIFGKQSSNEGKDITGVAALLKEADAMYEAGNKKEVKKLLEGKFTENPEVLWRLARSYYDTAEEMPAASKLDRKRICEKAMEVITQALEKSDGSFAVHKWYGIILNKSAEYQGTSATIQSSFIVKEHWEKAAALNPKDPTSCSLLGEWHFSVAGITGLKRSLAATLFATPPTATYAQALEYFLRAEAIQAGFWLKNQLNIAKCYIEEKDMGNAKMWLSKLVNEGKVVTSEDRATVAEAKRLLGKI